MCFRELRMAIAISRRASIPRLVTQFLNPKPRWSERCLPGTRPRVGASGHRAPFKWPAGCDSIWQAAVGAIDGLGDAEKSRLSRQGLLWQNRDVCPAESHPTVAAKGRF